jgi:hypothetical protein
MCALYESAERIIGMLGDLRRMLPIIAAVMRTKRAEDVQVVPVLTMRTFGFAFDFAERKSVVVM